MNAEDEGECAYAALDFSSSSTSISPLRDVNTNTSHRSQIAEKARNVSVVFAFYHLSVIGACCIHLSFTSCRSSRGIWHFSSSSATVVFISDFHVSLKPVVLSMEAFTFEEALFVLDVISSSGVLDLYSVDALPVKGEW